MGTSSREERQAEPKPRQSYQEGEARRGVGAQEQVQADGRGAVQGTGHEPGLGAEAGASQRILDNKNKQIYRVLFFNARSIVSKVDILQTEFQARSKKPDIICICETFCNDQHSDAYLNILGYEIVSRRDGTDTANRNFC